MTEGDDEYGSSWAYKEHYPNGLPDAAAEAQDGEILGNRPKRTEKEIKEAGERRVRGVESNAGRRPDTTPPAKLKPAQQLPDPKHGRRG